MRLTKDTENLGLPKWMRFGIELEVENLDFKKITKTIESMNWHTQKDQSLTDSGTECISPILQESENKLVWKEVCNVCNGIKECSADGKRAPYTDHTCGGHIHFDGRIFKENPDMMKNFLRLWAESEELVYKMCNAPNDPIRPGAMENSKITMKELAKTFFSSPLPSKEDRMENGKPKTIIQLAREILKNMNNNFDNGYRKINSIIGNLLLSKDGMASPVSAKIKEQLDQGKLKIGKPNSRLYKALIVNNKLDSRRYAGLNLTNFGAGKKNTIEFRLSNGTIDPQIVKENVFLYASILNTAVEMTRNPEKYTEKLQEFYKRDVTEEEKAKAFLGLVMDNQEDRQVYMGRWKSVKDAPVFLNSKGSKKFASGTFIKDDYRDAADRTHAGKLKETFNFISNLRNRVFDKQKEEIGIGQY